MRLSNFLATVFFTIASTTLAPAQDGAGFPPLYPVPHTGELKDEPDATHFHFIAAGDNRPKQKTDKQPKVLSELFKHAAKSKPAFFLWCGDIIYGHQMHHKKLEAQYKEFFEIAKLATVPVFNAPGNHEMDTVQTRGYTKIETPDAELQKEYLKFMKFPEGAPAYGAFNYGNSRFIALNTEEVGSSLLPPSSSSATPDATTGKLKLDPGYVSNAQFDLLARDLAANTAKAHIFVFMHHPIMAAKSSSALNSTDAHKLQALFAMYPNVSYVIAAHEHLYFNATGTTLMPADRQDPSSQGPSYLVTGGAGAPLDKCPDPAAANCKSFNHYLAFEVDKDLVKVQVIEVR